jgi:hypothetical protein
MLCVVISDTHVGSIVAPWPEDSPLPDGGHWKPTKIQKWLWNNWKIQEEEIAALKPDAIIINGDEHDGTNPKNAMIVTNRIDFQAGATVDLLQRLRDMTNRFYMIAGTGWHTGNGSQHTTSIAEQLEATPNPETGEVVWPDLLLGVGGRDVIHIAHHVGSTVTSAYEATAMLRSLYDVRAEFEKAYGVTAPNVVGIVRSHRHRSIIVQKGNLIAACTPGWQFPTEFSNKIGPGRMPEIGYHVIRYDDGVLSMKARLFNIPKRHVEVIK